MIFIPYNDLQEMHEIIHTLWCITDKENCSHSYDSYYVKRGNVYFETELFRLSYYVTIGILGEEKIPIYFNGEWRHPEYKRLVSQTIRAGVKEFNDRKSQRKKEERNKIKKLLEVKEL